MLNAGKVGAAATVASGAAGAAANASTVLAARAVVLSLLPVLKAAGIALVVAGVGYALISGLQAQLRKRNLETIKMLAAGSVEELRGTPAGTAPGPAPAAPVAASPTTASAGEGAGAGRTPAPSTPSESDGPGWTDLPRR